MGHVRSHWDCRSQVEDTRVPQILKDSRLTSDSKLFVINFLDLPVTTLVEVS